MAFPKPPYPKGFSWEFFPSDTTLPRISLSGSAAKTNTWAGQIVTSGLVIVTTLSEGDARWTFNVQSRNWGKAQLSRDQVYVGMGPVCQWLFQCPPLSDPPRPSGPNGQLGQTFAQIDTFNLRTGYNRFKPVVGGPNDSLSYSTGVPGPIHFKHAVNTAALRDSSKYWLAQASPGVGRLSAGPCDRSVVDSLLPLARKHEGIDAYPNSHYETWYDGYGLYYAPRIEQLVTKGLPTTQALWAIGATAFRQSKAHSDSVTDDKNNDPAYHKCDLNN